MEASANDKTIIVATQSHLFLNREYPNANIIAEIRDGYCILEQVSDRNKLFDTTYNLLGSSLSDLFFPNNFLIVEGSSDQVICEKCAELLEIPQEQVKVVSANGLDNVENSFQAIENTLKPLIMNTSPYSKKVVVLIITRQRQGKREGLLNLRS
jgi:hypothetical protein